MSAEIYLLPGVTLPAPGETKASDIALYCRRLADLIDEGIVPIESAVMVLNWGTSVNVQVLGATPVHAMGLLGIAQRVVSAG